jgi:hypothetical protein
MTERQTTLDLNGPILSFIQQPDAVSTTLSTATFVGIATATFPTQTPANPATNTGTIEYRWYAEGSALTDGSFRGATISGTATTTLTLSSLKSPETNNVNFFLRADYTPSAYGLPGVAVTVGSARSTGNAVNDPLDSNVATLTVLPTITITSQPGIATVGAGSRVSFAVESSISDSGFGDLSYQWNVDGQNLTDNGTTIIGANQPTLFFSPTVVGVSTVKVTVSNPNAVSVTSNVVDLFVLTPRNIIIFEGFDSQNNYSKREVNLGFVNDFTLVDDTFGSNFNTITFHASENNIDADLEIRTSKGSDTGSFSGGQGGLSRIRITLEKDIEYTVLGISNNSGLFIYRRSTLIAAVGKGGNAGTAGNGGSGGGINLSGENGSGRGAGVGGVRLSAGQLTLNGIFGSNSTATTFQSGDSKATIPNGGRTISCPKGSYWVSTRGIPPCSNMPLTQFHNTNGTLISQSSLINRGFKPGYSITSTDGARISNGGNGGTGATGGAGGNEGGGGGGSGYTDDSYTLISTSSGGNNSFKSTINFRIYVPPAPVVVVPYSPAPPDPPDPPPTPTRITAESIYGTGFVGIDRYANGTEGFAAGVAGGGTQGFIDSVKPEALATLPGGSTGVNATGLTNQQTANFLITYYEQTFNRLPDAGGFDYWLSSAAAGAYGNSTDGLVAAIVAATPTEAAVVQDNGGRTGVYALWTDGTTDASRGLNPSLGGTTNL